jgi:hypothetical protein
MTCETLEKAQLIIKATMMPQVVGDQKIYSLYTGTLNAATVIGI